MTAQQYTPITILPSKELEPIIGNVETTIKERLGSQEEIDPEIRPYVKVHPKSIDVDEGLSRLGVKPQPQDLTLEPEIALPLTDAKIIEGMHKPITSSWRWLAEFCMRLLRHIHVALKTVHGRIVRIKRN